VNKAPEVVAQFVDLSTTDPEIEGSNLFFLFCCYSQQHRDRSTIVTFCMASNSLKSSMSYLVLRFELVFNLT
jgi:hypothetical protein